MSLFKKMTIFLCLLAILYIAYGGIMHWQLNRFNGLLELLQNHAMIVNKSTLIANRDLISISRNIKDMILIKDPERRKMRLSEIDTEVESVNQNLNLVLERTIGDVGRQSVQKAILLVKESDVIRNEILSALFSNQDALAAEIADKEGTAIMTKIEDVMGKILDYADAKSVEYRIQGINELRRSKIILFSAGFMIVILSMAFAIRSVYAVLAHFAKTREEIKHAMGPPIDLSVRFDTSTIVLGINEALNNLFDRLNEDFHGVIEEMANLSRDLGTSPLDQCTTESVDNLMNSMEQTTEKITEFTDHGLYGDWRLSAQIDLLKQVDADIRLITQIVASRDTVIEQLKHTKALIDKESLESLD